MSDIEEEVDLEKLQNQLKVSEIMKNDIKQQCQKRNENLARQLNDLQIQNTNLRLHMKHLDKYIKKLSLVHSQLTAIGSYQLEKSDVDEILRLIETI